MLRFLLATALLGFSLVDAGQVISRMRPRRLVRADAHQPGSARDADGVGPERDMQQFEVAIERLQRSPNRLAALKTMLDYLERARDHPRDIRARSVCLWEPAFRTHIATSDGGLQALQAAGFDEIAKDDRGTPFLVMRRLDQRVVRKVIAITAAKLASAEAEADYEGVAQASASVDGGDAGASGGGGGGGARDTDSRGGGGDRRGGGGSSDDEDDLAKSESTEGESVERALVKQISGMISGLIHELERQTGGSADANVSDARGGAADNSSSRAAPSPPVHFRVYRSPSFPGFPPGGLPFLPGGLGGAVGGDGDEEGEVAVLERRLRAASLPAEAEEVAMRELKRLRRMSPMHSECAAH